MSIDAPGAQMPDCSTSSQEINYIDTFVEYVAEVVMKYDNAIPESKNREQKELQQHKQFEVAFQKTFPIIFTFMEIKTKSYFLNTSDKFAYQFVKEINPPPPKA